MFPAVFDSATGKIVTRHDDDDGTSRVKNDGNDGFITLPMTITAFLSTETAMTVENFPAVPPLQKPALTVTIIPAVSGYRALSDDVVWNAANMTISVSDG